MINLVFPQRLHRLAYFIRAAAADALTYFLYSHVSNEYSATWWILAAAVWLYGTFFIILPRIRDTGMNRWWLLLTFVPVANVVFGIILLFRAPAYLSHRPHPPLEPIPIEVGTP